MLKNKLSGFTSNDIPSLINTVYKGIGNKYYMVALYIILFVIFNFVFVIFILIFTYSLLRLVPYGQTYIFYRRGSPVSYGGYEKNGRVYMDFRSYKTIKIKQSLFLSNYQYR